MLIQSSKNCSQFKLRKWDEPNADRRKSQTDKRLDETKWPTNRFSHCQYVCAFVYKRSILSWMSGWPNTCYHEICSWNLRFSIAIKSTICSMTTLTAFLLKKAIERCQIGMGFIDKTVNNVMIEGSNQRQMHTRIPSTHTHTHISHTTHIHYK